MNQQNRVVYPARSSPLSVLAIVGFSLFVGPAALFIVIGMIGWILATLESLFTFGGLFK
jgi:hypothetical protein